MSKAWKAFKKERQRLRAGGFSFVENDDEPRWSTSVNVLGTYHHTGIQFNASATTWQSDIESPELDWQSQEYKTLDGAWDALVRMWSQNTSDKVTMKAIGLASL